MAGQEEGKTLDEQIAAAKKRDKLQKEIDMLEKLTRAENNRRKSLNLCRR